MQFYAMDRIIINCLRTKFTSVRLSDTKSLFSDMFRANSSKNKISGKRRKATEKKKLTNQINRYSMYSRNET